MVGAIGLSTPILAERLRIAHEAGFADAAAANGWTVYFL